MYSKKCKQLASARTSFDVGPLLTTNHEFARIRSQRQAHRETPDLEKNPTLAINSQLRSTQFPLVRFGLPMGWHPLSIRFFQSSANWNNSTPRFHRLLLKTVQGMGAETSAAAMRTDATIRKPM
jgi:hypothetical protein